jgi:hypothetical protein
MLVATYIQGDPMRLAPLLATPLLAMSLLLPAGLTHASTMHATKACSLFTASDATKVLGGTVKPALNPKEGVFVTCSYARQKPYNLIISLFASTSDIQKSKSGKTASSLFDETQKGSPGKKVILKGLGNKAFYLPGLHELWVVKGNMLFEVNGMRLSQTTLTKAAQLILKHIK